MITITSYTSPILYFSTDNKQILGTKSHTFPEIYLIVISQTFWKRYIMRKYLKRSAETTFTLLRNDQTSASFDFCTKDGKEDLPERIRGLIFLFFPRPLLLTPADFFPMPLLLPATTSLCKSLLLGQGLACLDIKSNNFSSLQRMVYMLGEGFFKSQSP